MLHQTFLNEELDNNYTDSSDSEIRELEDCEEDGVLGDYREDEFDAISATVVKKSDKSNISFFEPYLNERFDFARLLRTLGIFSRDVLGIEEESIVQKLESLPG